MPKRVYTSWAMFCVSNLNALVENQQNNLAILVEFVDIDKFERLWYNKIVLSARKSKVNDLCIEVYISKKLYFTWVIIGGMYEKNFFCWFSDYIPDGYFFVLRRK